MKKIVVAISGASGSIYGIDLLKKLNQHSDIETHLIMSDWAKENIKLETSLQPTDVADYADYVYDNHNLGAAISSGSFKINAMVIAPASMKTIAGITIGYDEDLIMRTASVMMKEQHKLILVPRETPLSAIHLENLAKLARIGVHVVPPIPSFYDHPQTIQDIIDHQSMKIMDSLGIETNFGKRWNGKNAKKDFFR